jgi:hypothetical protein
MHGNARKMHACFSLADLRHLKQPIGVAGRETKLVEKLPKALAGSLPTVEEIEAELSGTPRRKVKGRKA